MKAELPFAATLPAKAATGIVGFDEICVGGLPHGGTTRLVGGPGSGKTIFALQFLALLPDPAALEVRLKSLQVELVAKQLEKTLLVQATESREGELSSSRIRLGGLRGAEAAEAAP